MTFDALPGERFSAEVTEVGVAASRLGTTYPVQVRLQQADARIRPGMASEVAFRFKAGKSGGVIVPAQAVGEDREGRFVFVVEPADAGLGVARRRPVTVGELTEAGLEVLSGLADGDALITAGVSRISDGQKVRFTAAAESRP